MYPTYPEVETRTFTKEGANGFEVSVNCNSLLRIERDGIWYEIKINKNHLGRYTSNPKMTRIQWTMNLVAEAVNLFHADVHKHRVMHIIDEHSLSYRDAFDQPLIVKASIQKDEKEMILDRDPYLSKMVKQA